MRRWIITLFIAVGLVSCSHKPSNPCGMHGGSVWSSNHNDVTQCADGHLYVFDGQEWILQTP